VLEGLNGQVVSLLCDVTQSLWP